MKSVKSNCVCVCVCRAEAGGRGILHAASRKHTLADQSSRGMLFVRLHLLVLLACEANTAANSIEGISGGLVRVRRVSVLTLYPDLWSRASLACVYLRVFNNFTLLLKRDPCGLVTCESVSHSESWEAVFMAKARAVARWMERLGLDRKQALDRWDLEVATAKVTNQNGPVGSALQIPVKVDDFLIVEDAIVDEKIKEKEFKRQKFSDETDELMDEGLLGRAGREEDIEKFGCARMDNPDVVSSLFGRPNKIAVGVIESAAAEEKDQGKEKENRKSFDAATEKLALQNKLNQMLDKEAAALSHLLQEVVAFTDDGFDSAMASTETPLNELAAMKLLRARRLVAQALLGNYAPGKAQADDPATGQADADHYEAVMKCNPEAELPESFAQMQPLLHISQKLATELKTLATAAERKSIEAEFKPVVNIIALMRTSLKSALNKTKKFNKDRQAREER